MALVGCDDDREVGLRHLQRDRVDVEPLRAVHAHRVGGRDQVQVLERAQHTEVEDAAHVDVEPVGALPREHLAAVADVVHGRAGEVLVVRRAPRPHVDGRDSQPLREHRCLAVAFGSSDPVELRPVPRRIRDRLDLPGVVQERLAVADLGVEVEAVRDVALRLAAVADVDGVGDVIAELVEVRTALRVLERNEVGDDRDLVRFVAADERVDIGVVRNRILRDLRCFAM